MRLMKMFGLAAIASMAFIGASSAMAENPTVLCKVNELKCPEGQEYTGHVEALSEFIRFKGPLNVTCNHTHLLGEALGLANPLIVHITLLGFKECNCTVEVKDQTALLFALKTAPNLALAEINGFEIKVTCFGVTCVYGGAVEGLHVLGSANSTSDATIVANEVELEVREGSSLFCFQNKGLFTASYKILLPLPIYVSE